MSNHHEGFHLHQLEGRGEGLYVDLVVLEDQSDPLEQVTVGDHLQLLQDQEDPPLDEHLEK